MVDKPNDELDDDKCNGDETEELVGRCEVRMLKADVLV